MLLAGNPDFEIPGMGAPGRRGRGRGGYGMGGPGETAACECGGAWWGWAVS
jgi:hypothetical protein